MDHLLRDQGAVASLAPETREDDDPGIRRLPPLEATVEFRVRAADLQQAGVSVIAQPRGKEALPVVAAEGHDLRASVDVNAFVKTTTRKLVREIEQAVWKEGFIRRM